ncbi:hypothetical protein SARC_00025 [Sphaeroforma arctica JP610]|uniref:WHIM2 domain-containing protein n=1 Tax=Sphaeroforma arctica JP610 TaxID=667725 RepID=A0A0L0GHR5_9EUKA|nr:hypothetical protein SARC_00025 [Sphaeroforma arctica JP610]KNC87893.1 hypothetical protein SARC_00025 [Sphaeroforma arctica JP610]|eukprot:XP_014161795.1 hypothetical protein SARC_00025 [Sphaeroforma arctica JP610]
MKRDDEEFDMHSRSKTQPWKHVSLGTDRFHQRYWYFAATPSKIFIETPDPGFSPKFDENNKRIDSEETVSQPSTDGEIKSEVNVTGEINVQREEIVAQDPNLLKEEGAPTSGAVVPPPAATHTTQNGNHVQPNVNAHVPNSTALQVKASPGRNGLWAGATANENSTVTATASTPTATANVTANPAPATAKTEPVIPMVVDQPRPVAGAGVQGENSGGVASPAAQAIHQDTVPVGTPRASTALCEGAPGQAVADMGVPAGAVAEVGQGGNTGAPVPLKTEPWAGTGAEVNQTSKATTNGSTLDHGQSTEGIVTGTPAIVGTDVKVVKPSVTDLSAGNQSMSMNMHTPTTPQVAPGAGQQPQPHVQPQAQSAQGNTATHIHTQTPIQPQGQAQINPQTHTQSQAMPQTLPLAQPQVQAGLQPQPQPQLQAQINPQQAMPQTLTLAQPQLQSQSQTQPQLQSQSQTQPQPQLQSQTQTQTPQPQPQFHSQTQTPQPQLQFQTLTLTQTPTPSAGVAHPAIAQGNSTVLNGSAPGTTPTVPSGTTGTSQSPNTTSGGVESVPVALQHPYPTLKPGQEKWACIDTSRVDELMMSLNTWGLREYGLYSSLKVLRERLERTVFETARRKAVASNAKHDNDDGHPPTSVNGSNVSGTNVTAA